MNSLFRKAIEQYFADMRCAEPYQVIFGYGPESGSDSTKAFQIRVYTQNWDLIADYRNQEAVQFLDHLLDHTGSGSE
ncbi:hypothetical protein [Streptomyces sp. NBC_01506]|uniref:hypothetical protein n=1 Tax=Streptomyces sp. NBC_01506 TaxID=2903887 RepID=UPI00386C7C8A